MEPNSLDRMKVVKHRTNEQVFEDAVTGDWEAQLVEGPLRLSFINVKC